MVGLTWSQPSSNAFPRAFNWVIHKSSCQMYARATPRAGLSPPDAGRGHRTPVESTGFHKPVSGKLQPAPEPFRSEHKINCTTELVGD
jgi:hypothetical protein